MSIPEEIIYEILTYGTSLPKYGRASTKFKGAEQLFRKKNMERMDKEYPLWKKKVTKNDNKYSIEYSIPMYYLNRTAIEDKWDDFLDIVHYHGVNIVPIALGITHLFNKHEIAHMIINIYKWDVIINSTKNVDHIKYRYPVLYYMWKLDYSEKKIYLVGWTEISHYDKIGHIIGYVTPDMLIYAKNHHEFRNMKVLDELFSSQNYKYFKQMNMKVLKYISKNLNETTFSQLLLDLASDTDDLIEIIIRSPFVNSDMIQYIKDAVSNTPDLEIYELYPNPIFLWYESGVKTSINIDSSPAIKLVDALSSNKYSNDNILNTIIV